MYEYIKGPIIELTPSHVVIEAQNIGYFIHIPLKHYDALTGEKSAKLFIAPVIREDSHKLFGFVDKAARELFLMLSDVSGVGPKTAMNIIGHLDDKTLEIAILQKDIATLSKIPGIGKKSAERICVDMQDKILKKSQTVPSIPSFVPNDVFEDALSALLTLGYQRKSCIKALEKALKEFDSKPDLATLITASLKAV